MIIKADQPACMPKLFNGQLDEKHRYLAHLSTLIQRNYKVSEEVMDQENGKENEDDIHVFFYTSIAFISISRLRKDIF